VTAAELRLLGPVQLEPVDGHVPLRRPKQRVVLAKLAAIDVVGEPDLDEAVHPVRCLAPTSHLEAGHG
jgi:hypothetical protein